MFLSKGETEQYVNDIWTAKEVWERTATEDERIISIGSMEVNSKEIAERRKHIHLSAFFEIFLEVFIV